MRSSAIGRASQVGERVFERGLHVIIRSEHEHAGDVRGGGRERINCGADGFGFSDLSPVMITRSGIVSASLYVRKSRRVSARKRVSVEMCKMRNGSILPGTER